MCADINEELITSATGQRIALNFWFLNKTSGYRYFPHKQKFEASAWYQHRISGLADILKEGLTWAYLEPLTANKK